MRKRNIIITTILTAFVFTTKCFSQSVSISNNAATPDSSAMLDISSDKKGLLVPRMTAEQKSAIAKPATGLLVYQTDSDPGFYYYDGASWFLLVNSSITDRQNTLMYTIKGF